MIGGKGLRAGIQTCHSELTTILHHEAPECCGSNFVYIDCNSLSAADIIRYTQALQDATGRTPIVIVDYLQRLSPPIDGYTGSGADKVAIDANINMLYQLAKTMSTIVIALGSVAKAAFKTPLADDADEGSNRIMHAADNLFVLCPNDTKSKKDKESIDTDPNIRDMQLFVSKHRGGQAKCAVPFQYCPAADFYKCNGMPTDDNRIVYVRYKDILAKRSNDIISDLFSGMDDVEIGKIFSDNEVTQ